MEFSFSSFLSSNKVPGLRMSSHHSRMQLACRDVANVVILKK